MHNTPDELLELGAPGPMRDALVAAVLSGKKTATTSLAAQYEDGAQWLPQAGTRCVMVDSEGREVAVVEVVDVELIRLVMSSFNSRSMRARASGLSRSGERLMSCFGRPRSSWTQEPGRAAPG